MLLVINLKISIFIIIYDIYHYSLLPKLGRIINTLSLSDCYWITPEYISIEQVKKKLQDGIKQIQFRIKQDFDQSTKLYYNKIDNLCNDYDAKLILNAPNIYDIEVNLHLNSTLLTKLNTRPISHQYLLGVSVHNQLELTKAMQIKADFAVLSPVLRTHSHIHVMPLGWDYSEQLISQAKLPIYCLGGMNMNYLSQAQSIGAIGIAGISQI